MYPISDMLIMIKNASNASKDVVIAPYSKFKHAIAECLKKEGFIEHVYKKIQKRGLPILEIGIKRIDKKPRITDVKIISKPSRRVYLGVEDVRPVKNGYGILVLSTPRGILTDKQSRQQKVGGEALFSIW